MRVFICAYAGFSAAVPMDSVSSLILYTGKVLQTVNYNQQNGNTYISLPRLFSRPLSDVRHGIILKDGNDDYNEATENKIILLTTKVEYEMDIPPEQIYPLPKIFDCLRISAFFSGILFIADHPMLLINIEKLVENIKRKIPA